MASKLMEWRGFVNYWYIRFFWILMLEEALEITNTVARAMSRKESRQAKAHSRSWLLFKNRPLDFSWNAFFTRQGCVHCRSKGENANTFITLIFWISFTSAPAKKKNWKELSAVGPELATTLTLPTTSGTTNLTKLDVQACRW